MVLLGGKERLLVAACQIEDVVAYLATLRD